MSYRIVYEGTEPSPTNATVLRPKRYKAIVFVAVVLLLSVLYMLFPNHIKQVIIPGDANVTAEATEQMIREIRSGEPVWGSVEAFCREILANAE